ncbi:MAG: ArgE/DapE family deacylase [Pseudomonadota bacterium]|nr:ArgE/DapE family deacylase [Pseudomonadota bacterium]
MTMAPLDDAARAAIRAAVDANFATQTAFLADFVRIPSIRFEEGPAQDFMAAALRERGYEVDDWKIDLKDLESLRGYGPIEGDFSRARTVVGSHRPKDVHGRSLILQGHLDVVPAGPLDMWETPPFDPVVKDGWMHGRGACDMKSGTTAALFALDALRKAGFEPAATVHFQSVIEEESTGLGALSTLQRGYRADLAFIPEPTGFRVLRAQVGVIWFKLKVRGKPVHVSVAGEGSNAITAAFDMINAVKGLEIIWNERAKEHPNFVDVVHPLNFNPGKIAGGDWASSVPAWCDVDCRIGVLPGWDLADCRREIEDCITAAARQHPFLANSPPEVVWNGFMSEGWVLEGAEEPEAEFKATWGEVFGDEPLIEGNNTGLTDTRFYPYYGVPAVCWGPKGLNVHGFDEKVDLASVKKATEMMALFIARWCGLNKLEG